MRSSEQRKKAQVPLMWMQRRLGTNPPSREEPGTKSWDLSLLWTGHPVLHTPRPSLGWLSPAAERYLSSGAMCTH